MQRAFELADRGLGKARPNPIVGCVIVHENSIIGEGWHEQYGGPHAEVNALSSVGDKEVLKNSIVYVTLEPCAHFGKTPPCADLLIHHRVKQVIIANTDPNPLVAGKGISKLRESGIDVITGVGEYKGRILNRRFLTFMEKQRPFIILKWAQTKDHFIARKNFDSKWISNELSRRLVHRWRAEEHAILVGTQTALSDNPQLTVRDWSGDNPVRIVIDKDMRLPTTHHLFDQKTPTLCYTLSREDEQKNLSFIKLRPDQFEQQLINDLFRRQIQSVIIEGGSKTLESFITLGLWDEARVFTSPQVFGTGIEAPKLHAKRVSEEQIGNDLLCFFEPLLL